MPISKEEKTSVIQNYASPVNNTGSAEVIIAILTHEIRNLTEHFKTHRKDYHSKLGMMKKIGRRNKLLRWLKSQSKDRYQNLVSSLNIRG